MIRQYGWVVALVAAGLVLAALLSMLLWNVPGAEAPGYCVMPLPWGIAMYCH